MKVTRITVKPGSKGANILSAMRQKKEERIKNLTEKYSVPPIICKFIEDKIKNTAALNGQGFAKEEFRLGLWVMWHEINNNPEIRKELKDLL